MDLDVCRLLRLAARAASPLRVRTAGLDRVDHGAMNVQAATLEKIREHGPAALRTQPGIIHRVGFLHSAATGWGTTGKRGIGGFVSGWK